MSRNRNLYESRFNRHSGGGGGGSSSSHNAPSRSIMDDFGGGGLGGLPPLRAGYSSKQGSGGGGGGYAEDDYDDRFSGGASGSRGGGGYDYDQERVARDGGLRQKSGNNYGDTGGSSGGGWRHRSPSPPVGYGSSKQERVTRNPGIPAWSLQSDTSYNSNANDNLSSFQMDTQQQLSNVFGSSGGGSGILRNPLSGSSSILGSQSAIPDLMMMSAAASGGGLMGNLGLAQNPFNVLGGLGQQILASNLSAAFNQPFGQQVIQPAANFGGQGLGFGQQQQQNLNIFGPQTQQGFNSFDSNNRSSSGGGGFNSRVPRQGGQNRRSDANNRSSFGNNKSSPIGRTDSPNAARKRNLVLRDPHPETERKKARTSLSISGGGGRGNRGNRGGRASGGNPTQVKRISIGIAKPGGIKRKSVDASKNLKPKPTPVTSAPSTTTAAAPGVSGKKDDKTKGEASPVKDKAEEKKDKKSKFDEIPTVLLVCKVCQKSMNDGGSYESHLNGRAHLSLMKIIEQRFARRAELLMSESKLQEEEIGIEMERQRRAGKGGRAEKNANNYCKMCDCNYVVNWGTHKVSLGHRVLKEFLHPTCRFCSTHFMHRIEWVNHILSAAHMKRISEIKAEGDGSVVSVIEQESIFQDELFTIGVDLTRDERPTNAITIRNLAGKDGLTEEMKDILKNDKGEIDLPKGNIPIPETYDESAEIGEEAIVPVTGSRCRICRVYIPDDKDVEAHCKTKEHFHMYVNFLKRVVRHRELQEEEKKAAEEKAKKDDERKEKEAERKKAAELKKAEAEAKQTNGVDAKTTDNDGEVMIIEDVMEEGHQGQDLKKADHDVVLLDEANGDEGGEEMDTEQQGGDVEMITKDEVILVEAKSVDSSKTGEDKAKEGVPKQQEEEMKPLPLSRTSLNNTAAHESVTVQKAVEVEKPAASSGSISIDSSVKVDEGTATGEGKSLSSPQKQGIRAEELLPAVVCLEPLVVPEAGADGTDGVIPAVSAALLGSPPQQAARAGGQTARRSPRVRGGPPRGTPAQRRGAPLRNVTPRVDTNLRGGRGGGGGQGRGNRGHGRASPRGGRGGRRPNFR